MNICKICTFLKTSDPYRCATSPCKNNATCYNYGIDYFCICEAGYEGVNCSANTNDCVNVSSEVWCCVVVCCDVRWCEVVWCTSVSVNNYLCNVVIRCSLTY